MTQNFTDPRSMAVQALALVDEQAARIRSVTNQLITEHGAELPPLLAIHMEASTTRAHVTLQAHTDSDAEEWAQALGVTLTASPDAGGELGHHVHYATEFAVGEVGVRISAVTWVPTARGAAVPA